MIVQNKIIKISSIAVYLISLVFISSCTNTDEITVNPNTKTPAEFLNDIIDSVDSNQLAADIQAIDDYLESEGLTDVILKEPEGVRYKINELGTGVRPALTSLIEFKFSGELLDTGEVFDSSELLDTSVFNLIPGLQTTLPLLPIGTVATIYIPSGLAYGVEGARDASGNIIIPANANIIFEIELLGIFQ